MSTQIDLSWWQVADPIFLYMGLRRSLCSIMLKIIPIPNNVVLNFGHRINIKLFHQKAGSSALSRFCSMGLTL